MTRTPCSRVSAKVIFSGRSGANIADPAADQAGGEANLAPLVEPFGGPGPRGARDQRLRRNGWVKINGSSAFLTNCFACLPAGRCRTAGRVSSESWAEQEGAGRHLAGEKGGVSPYRSL